MLTGRFPADTGFDNLGQGGQLREGAGHIETKVKPNNWYEILQVFAPIATIAIVLYYFYNKTLPTQFFDKATDWAGMSEEDIKKMLRVGPAPKLGKPKTVSSQALSNTLKPPDLQAVKVAAVRPPNTGSQSQSTSVKLPANNIKAPSTYAGSMDGMSKKATSSVAPSISKFPSTARLPQNSASKVIPNQKAPQKPAGQATKPQTKSVKEVPKQKAPSVQSTAAKVPAKAAPNQKAPSVQAPAPKAPAKAAPNAEASVKNAPTKEDSTTTPQKMTATPTAAKKAAPANNLPASKPDVKPGAPMTTKNDVTKKEAITPKANMKTATPSAVKKNDSAKKTPAKTTAAPTAPNPNKPPQKIPAKAKSAQQSQTTGVKTSLPATKTNPKSSSKAPTQQQNVSKTPIKPKSEPQKPSIKTDQGAWSETTAVEDPFTERPSGKRIVKAQPTRKDRVKVAKKLQRQHLDHLTS